ncbi:MAG: SDR family oxidoreductase [Pseudomonadota bacterium]
MNYSGKHVFVAGGTTGINFGIAKAFAAAGARLFVVSRKAENVEAACSELGDAAHGATADVRDFAAVEAAFADAAAHHGEIDVLISGAAGNFPAFANALSPNGFKAVVDIDLLGTFHVMRAAYPHLRKPGGVVINISAPQAALPMEAQVHVCAAKAGVDMVTRTLAMEWGPDGLRVLSVIPGPIGGTEGMRRLAPTEAMMERCRETVPLRRIGAPDDVADACLALASDACRYVTGAIIPVDGGWSLGGAGAAMSEIVGEAVKAGALAREA